MPMYRRIFGLIIGIFFITGTTFGQSLDFNLEPNITLSLNPSDPEPGEEIVITLVSYETNLDLAYITWSGGTAQKSGYGETEFITRAGLEEDKSTIIRAEITLENGQRIQKETTVTPATYNIAWEAINAKYPPFYMGKKLPIRENAVRVAVIKTDDTKQTSYTWTRNDKSIKSSGGTAAPYVDFTNSETEKTEKITVSIATPSKRASRTLFVPLTGRKILFYEFSPLNGLLLGRTVKESVVGYENTVSLFVLPLGINNLSNSLVTWNLSGREVTNQENPYLLTFEKPDESGRVPISAKIENLRSLYQEFNGALNLIF